MKASHKIIAFVTVQLNQYRRGRGIGSARLARLLEVEQRRAPIKLNNVDFGIDSKAIEKKLPTYSLCDLHS